MISLKDIDFQEVIKHLDFIETNELDPYAKNYYPSRHYTQDSLNEYLLDKYGYDIGFLGITLDPEFNKMRHDVASVLSDLGYEVGFTLHNGDWQNGFGDNSHDR